MEKMIRRIENTKEELWKKDRCTARKRILADAAVLVVLTVCIRLFYGWMNIEYENVFNRTYNVFCNSMAESAGKGSATGWVELGKSMTPVAESLVPDNKTVGTVNEILDVKVLSEKTTGTVTKPVAEVNEQKQESQAVTESVAENKESTVVAVPDTVIKENPSVIENEIVEEEAERAKEPAGLFNLDGFMLNEAGVIESCENPELVVNDGIIILPSDSRCTGIGSEALTGVCGAEEIYIPANVTTIETGALEKLSGLMYIEVAQDNPAYESVDGALYDRSGELLINPQLCLEK